MKRVLALALALVLVLSLVACGGGEQKKDSKTPIADELKQAAEEDEKGGLYERDWILYNWITKSINSFKNPSSVELGEKYFYCKGTTEGEYKFFLVEIRADNSFGGKSVGYCMVTPSSISETEWQPLNGSFNYQGEEVYRRDIGSFLKDAVKEYIGNTYG